MERPAEESRLNGFDDLAGPQASGADTQGTHAAFDLRTYFMEIREKTAARGIVGMADIITTHRTLTANITTSSHVEFSLFDHVFRKWGRTLVEAGR